MGYDKQRVKRAIEDFGDCGGDAEAVQELLDHVEAMEARRKVLKLRNSMTMELTVKTESVAAGIDELRETLEKHKADLSPEATAAILLWLRNQIEARKAS